MLNKCYKRMTAMLLAGTMILSMAACGQTPADNDNKETTESTVESSVEETQLAEYVNLDSHYPICAEPITITASGYDGNGGADWNETDIFQYIGEKMGINIEATPFAEDAWATQFTLMLSSDELPDIIFRTETGMNEINKHGEDGYFLPLNEYFDYMPNFKAYLDAHPDYKSVITAADGNIYGLASYNENMIGRVRRTFINKTWLDNVGKEMPTTIDELYDVLKAFKEQDANGNGDPNDEIPLSSGYDLMWSIMHGYGILSNSMDYSPMVDKDGKVYLGQASEGYKELLKFMKKLLDEGLYDKDGLVQTTDEFRAKFAEDRIGMFGTWSAPYVEGKTDISSDQNWLWLDGLTSEYNDVNAVVYSAAASANAKIAVNVDTEYPEAVCRLIDWLYTDEGSVMASRGVEGKGLKYEDVDYLDNVKVSMAVNPDENTYTSAEEYRYKKSVINEGMNVRSVYYSTMYQVLGDMSDEDLAMDIVLEKNGWQTLVERGRRQLTAVDEFPSLVYTQEEADRRSTIMTDIKMYTKQAYGQFVTGELDIDKDWDTYIQTLEQNGMTELMDIEQAAYDRVK